MVWLPVSVVPRAILAEALVYFDTEFNVFYIQSKCVPSQSPEMLVGYVGGL